MTAPSVISREVEAATQPSKMARPGFPSRCEILGFSAGSFDSAALRSG